MNIIIGQVAACPIHWIIFFINLIIIEIIQYNCSYHLTSFYENKFNSEKLTLDCHETWVVTIILKM